MPHWSAEEAGHGAACSMGGPNQASHDQRGHRRQDKKPTLSAPPLGAGALSVPSGLGVCKAALMRALCARRTLLAWPSSTRPTLPDKEACASGFLFVPVLAPAIAENREAPVLRLRKRGAPGAPLTDAATGATSLLLEAGGQCIAAVCAPAGGWGIGRQPLASAATTTGREAVPRLTSKTPARNDSVNVRGSWATHP